MSFQVSVLKNGSLSIKTNEQTTLEALLAFLDLSKEKKKHTRILVNQTEVSNPAAVIEPKDKILAVLDDSWLMNDETPMYYGAVPVVYEDDWCLVANKKPFLLVHGDGNTEDTLTARVNAYLAQEGWPFAAQPVNRIDYEASGLVLFCKHPLVQSYFDRQMEDGTAKKEYLAVVEGRVNNREIDINNPIARNRHEADKMMVYSKGKPAHTHISRLKLFNDKSLVKAVISTGRRHQIRVHLSNLGYPILNDPLYGIVRNNKGLMLQAYRLEFRQPFTHETITAELDMDTRFKWFDPQLAKSE
ncbi:MAG: RluA family pseudouridine synthase [Erysipelotrichaceae bacterium]|nr:RluA family pseudouridine synthase [Erysipelotrichaceae bacterium]